jgi:hypothetical protein
MQVSFNPNMPYDAMCERAARDLAEYRQAMQGEKEFLWRTWAGDRLDAMMISPEATIACLADLDGMLRLTAASLLAEYWPPNESFAGPCLQLAFTDPISPVRGGGLTCILFKLHPYIRDPSGMLGMLLGFLRSSEPKMSGDLMSDVQKAAKDAVDWANDRGVALYERLAGDHLADMLTSQMRAEGYLGHPDANLRCAGLLVLYKHWNLTADFRRICMRLIRDDPDVGVRIQAQDVLGAKYARTDDIEIGRFLAQIVLDEVEPIALRKQAYASLFVVRAMPVTRLLNTVSPDFRFPGEVDLAFVHSFLR